MNLSSDEKKLLLKLARKKIESRLDDDVKIPEVDFQKYSALKKKGGAFVTLTSLGELRGCIGYIVAESTIVETVSDAAEQAAFSDPRFPSLSKEELSNISIEISILSESYPMENYDEIELGKHGLILEEGVHRGLLLPQVPLEHNMSKEDYLNAICRKAGLKPDLWREKKLDLELFTATVFNENEVEVNYD